MPEARLWGIILVGLIGLFLCWGIDPSWRQEIIQFESRWLIEVLDDRAFAIAHAMDRTLQKVLGDSMAQPRGSYGEGLVMGLRQILTRIAALEPLSPLLLLTALGFFHEARALRALSASRFVYISPLLYRRVQGLPRACLMLAFAVLVAPLPLHPLELGAILISAAGTVAWRYARYMKQS